MPVNRRSRGFEHLRDELQNPNICNGFAGKRPRPIRRRQDLSGTPAQPHEGHICGREGIGDGEGQLALQIDIKDRNVRLVDRNGSHSCIDG